MGTLVELTTDECSALLAACTVGRVGSVVDGKPFVLPVNYRWLSHGGRNQIALRTRTGNVIDRAGGRVAFEIDGIDHANHTGWSVLVHGRLYHLHDVPDVRDMLDSGPWISEDRDSWLMIVVHEISGRRIAGPDPEWAFHLRGYL
jgi:nitroimidazol reductase NimA-like FMN-containing flavoprotein (pyridoxamine 5'-phosphate oxidase superfamily)